MTQKILTVENAVQKELLEKILFNEMNSGFWKKTRSENDPYLWKDIKVEIGDSLGAIGFKVPRNYNFLNPSFFDVAEDELMKIAKEVDSSITPKMLKKQLISLSQILGSRLKERGGIPTKLLRGRLATADYLSAKLSIFKSSSVRRVPATFVTEVKDTNTMIAA